MERYCGREILNETKKFHTKGEKTLKHGYENMKKTLNENMATGAHILF